VLSLHVLSYLVVTCHVLPCLVLSCLVLSCHVLPYFIFYSLSLTPHPLPTTFKNFFWCLIEKARHLCPNILEGCFSRSRFDLSWLVWLYSGRRVYTCLVLSCLSLNPPPPYPPLSLRLGEAFGCEINIVRIPPPPVLARLTDVVIKRSFWV
jgi:hypothetical protein